MTAAKETERVLLTCVVCASHAGAHSGEGARWLRRTSRSRLAACPVCLPWLAMQGRDAEMLESIVMAGASVIHSQLSLAPHDPAYEEQVTSGAQAWTGLHEVIAPDGDFRPVKHDHDAAARVAWMRGWSGMQTENLYLRAYAQGERAARRSWFEQREAVNPWRATSRANTAGRIAMWGWADGYIRPASQGPGNIAQASREREVYRDHAALGMEGAARARRGEPVELPLSARCFSHLSQRRHAFHGWWDGFVDACIAGDSRAGAGTPPRDIDVTPLLPAEVRQRYSDFPGVPFNVVRRVIRPNGSWIYVPLDDRSLASF